MKKICNFLNKKCFLSLLLIVCSIQVMSQKESPKTLMNSSKALINSSFQSISGFGSLLFSSMTVDGEIVALNGWGGAALFNHSFFVGGYGMGIVERQNISMNNTDYEVDFAHGGFWLGYILKPNELIHYRVETLLGWGEIDFNDERGFNYKRDRVSVFYPRVGGEVNITHWFRMDGGVGYKKTIGVDTYYDATDFDGLVFSLSLNFGRFR